jgi:hypothetical protein
MSALRYISIVSIGAILYTLVVSNYYIANCEFIIGYVNWITRILSTLLLDLWCTTLHNWFGLLQRMLNYIFLFYLLSFNFANLFRVSESKWKENDEDYLKKFGCWLLILLLNCFSWVLFNSWCHTWIGYCKKLAIWKRLYYDYLWNSNYLCCLGQ